MSWLLILFTPLYLILQHEMMIMHLKYICNYYFVCIYRYCLSCDKHFSTSKDIFTTALKVILKQHCSLNTLKILLHRQISLYYFLIFFFYWSIVALWCCISFYHVHFVYSKKNQLYVYIYHLFFCISFPFTSPQSTE